MKVIKLSSIVTALTVSAMSAMASTQAQAIGLVGLDIDNNLVIFDSASPGVTTRRPLVGVTLDLIGIDYRPTNGLLYGIGLDRNIYTIDTGTGVATFVATLASDVTSGGGSTGFDFNPVADTAAAANPVGVASLRVVNNLNENFAVNVNTGAVTTQTSLTHSSGQNPAITAAAYTNNFAGATATRLFDIDSAANTLVQQNPPAGGTLTTIGSLGIDFSEGGGFDIFGADTAFAVSNAAGTNIPNLYTINLNSGGATLVGAINNPQRITSLTAVPVPYEFPASLSLLAFGGFSLLKRKLKQQKPVILHTK